MLSKPLGFIQAGTDENVHGLVFYAPRLPFMAPNQQCKNTEASSERVTQQDAVVDGRLRPGAATWRTRRNIRVVLDSGPFPALYENMTSSTEPEVHNASHCRQSRTKLRLQVASTEKLRKLDEISSCGF